MKIIPSQTCCFTGHRSIPLKETLLLRIRLREKIRALAERGVITFLAGGALGFDTLAAQEVLRLREEELPQLQLGLVLPCLGQESRWSPEDAAVYHRLLRRADEVIYTGDQYTRSCMFVRNRYLVDHSAFCLCYLTRPGRSGTGYTVEYAREKGLAVFNLAGKTPPEETEEEQLSF